MATLSVVLEVLGFLISVADFILLWKIYKDDHEMLGVSRESLEAQKAYLEIRKKWYESRSKPKQ